MARKAKLVKAPLASLGGPPGINMAGPMQVRTIKKSKIVESEFTLDDKTVLRIKPILVDVKRAINQYNQFGDPLYLIQLVNTVDTKAPKTLKKLPTKQSKRKSKVKRP